MTDTIRDLLISLASHVAYMQGQLEARHELDDPEDYYWYRESVLLRQKVTDALADEPAVPQPPAEGDVAELVAELRMMASQAAEACQFTDAENLSRAADLLQRWAVAEESSVAAPVPVSERLPGQEDCDAPTVMEIVELADEIEAAGLGQVDLVRTALTRWGTSNLAETRSSLGGMPTPVPADKGEVEELVVDELVKRLRTKAATEKANRCHYSAILLTRAANLLQRLSPPQPVPVSERLPGQEDCDAEGRCWWWRTDDADEWWELLCISDAREYNAGCGNARYTHWLPAHALPIPHQQENAND